MSKLDLIVLRALADKFTDYVHEQDNNSVPISFIESKGVLAREEGYKEKLFDKAQTILRPDEWKESWIGTGEIRDRIFRVMDISANLINFNTKNDFKKHFERTGNQVDPDTERIIYEIYKGNDDKHAFDRAIKEFGAKYPILAYLFFVKDKTKYLPASPNNFDRCFAQMNVNFKMSYNCSWDNYSEFISIIRETQEELPKLMEFAHELSLLDAHSFVWMVGEEKFINWNKTPSDINSPIAPKKVINEPDGTIKYHCGRCEYLFTKAPRCPDCGQAVKE